jgi:hypothetical protein
MLPTALFRLLHCQLNIYNHKFIATQFLSKIPRTRVNRVIFFRSPERKRRTRGDRATSVVENVPETDITHTTPTSSSPTALPPRYAAAYQKPIYYRPFGLYTHYVEAFRAADGNHQALCQLPRNRCLAEADGPIRRPSLNRYELV